MALIFTTQWGCFYLLVAIEWPNWGWYIGEHFFPPLGWMPFQLNGDMIWFAFSFVVGRVFILYEDIINIVWMHIVSSMMSHGTWLLQWVWVNTLQVPHHVGWLVEFWMHVTNRFQLESIGELNSLPKERCPNLCFSFFSFLGRCGL
jgi:hypothetical protein